MTGALLGERCADAPAGGDTGQGEGMLKSAVISDCGRYRYLLTRRWGDGPALAFLMLNPSTADASVDDATIRKCIGFAQRQNFNAIEVVNLFAFRARDPKAMLTTADPVGPENNKYIIEAAMASGQVLCAWGPNASRTRRPRQVLDLLGKLGTKTLCLHVTKDGSPGHPLTLSYDRQLVPFPEE